MPMASTWAVRPSVALLYTGALDPSTPEGRTSRWAPTFFVLCYGFLSAVPLLAQDRQRARTVHVDRSYLLPLLASRLAMRCPPGGLWGYASSQFSAETSCFVILALAAVLNRTVVEGHVWKLVYYQRKDGYCQQPTAEAQEARGPRPSPPLHCSSSRRATPLCALRRKPWPIQTPFLAMATEIPDHRHPRTF
jgi:hypothetical protein